MTNIILTLLPVLITFGIAALTPSAEAHCDQADQPC
jgi:hypothetical protein